MRRNGRTRIASCWGAVALVVLALSCGEAQAVDFLRGDANADGEVTLSDAHFIQNYLFRGGTPADCLRSMDADGSEKINITDSMRLLNYAFRGGTPPVAPFPEAGADDGAAGAEDALGCEAYEVGPLLEDPAARLAVLEAVAPGGSDGKAKITLAISNSGILAGFAGTLLVDPEVIGTVDPTGADLLGVSESPGFNSVTLDGEHLKFGFLATLIYQDGIPVGEDVEVLELTVCLRDGTPAGDYPLAFEAAELVDFETGRAIPPVTIDGVLTVVETVAAGAGCEPGDPGGSGEECTEWQPYPDPIPPVNAVFEIRGARAPAGSDVTLPFSIVADAPVQAYSFSVDFDEEVLEPLGVDILFDIDRRPYPTIVDPDRIAGFEKIDINDANAQPGNDGVDEGYIIGAMVFSFLDNCHNVPANDQTDVLGLRFRVRPEADVATTEVRFLDGGQGEGYPVSNVLTAYGQAWTPDTAGSFILINGLVDVLPEIVVFIRGNANGDDKVDISDAQATLGYLFLGEDRPYCLDAADSNDDGSIDIADPIATLTYLFLGGPALPAPFPEEGTDPTADGIRCETLER